MLYSWTLFFIHSMYNSLHLLIPNSQAIPSLPALPLCNHKSVLYGGQVFLSETAGETRWCGGREWGPQQAQWGPQVLYVSMEGGGKARRTEQRK